MLYLIPVTWSLMFCGPSFKFFFWYYNAVKNGSNQNNGRKLKLKEIWKVVIASLECSEHWGPQGQAQLGAREDRLKLVCIDSHEPFLIVCHLKCNVWSLPLLNSCLSGKCKPGKTQQGGLLSEDFCLPVWEAPCSGPTFEDFIVFEEIGQKQYF